MSRESSHPSGDRPLAPSASLLGVIFALISCWETVFGQPALYWTAGVAGKIQRLELAENRIEDLVSAPLANPGNIFLDVESSLMYWNSRGRNQVRRASLDGSDVRDLVDGQLIEIDPQGGRMYFVRGDTLLSANMDGKGVETLWLGENVMDVWWGVSVALDLSREQVYWCSSEKSGVHREDLDGSGADVVYEGNAFGIKIDTAGAKIYWSTGGSCGSIVRAGLDGSGMETVLDDCVGLVSLDVLNGKLYWMKEWSSGPFKHDVGRSNLDGSEIEHLFSIDQWQRDPDGMALDPEHQMVYWTSDLRIQKSDFSGSELEDIIVSDMFAPRGLTLDPANGKMYWISIDNIQRSDISGSNRETVISGLGQWVWDLAMDTDRGTLYWTLPAGDDSTKIQRANSDGSGIEDVVTSEVIGNLAVDQKGGHIYWTSSGRIIRAGLDGSDLAVVVDLGDDALVHDIVPDPEHYRLYWTASRGSSGGIPEVEEIGWSSLDGCKSVVITLNSEPYAWWDSIQVDRESGYVYWAVTREGTIWRTSIYESGPKELVATLHGNITSLVLDASGITIDVAPGETPETPGLTQNYPNPFNPSTRFEYTLDEPGQVRVTVSDLLGHTVAVLVDRMLSPGSYSVAWTPAGNTAGGMYFYTLATGTGAVTRSMVLMR